MSRPKFPTGIVLPVACIWGIRERQDAYDRDPEGYERRERERAERFEEERRREEDWVAQQWQEVRDD